MNKNDLTDQMLMHFYEGNIEIKNYTGFYIYHGQIDLVYWKDGKLKIDCAWFARGDSFPPKPNGWKKVNRNELLLDLKHFRLSKPGNGNLYLTHRAISETTTLYPKNVNYVHPFAVKGLGI